MRLGTNNKQIYVIFKNLVKQLVFIFSISKFSQRKRLQNANTIEEKYQICNEILCIHQSKFEILKLVRKIQEKQPKVICEIGTADGGTSLFLGNCFPDLEIIICIDIFIKNKRQLSFFLQKKRVKFIDASSYHFNTIRRVNSIVAGKKIDFLFIDGDHKYSGVSKDFHSYFDLVAPNGVISFHDIVPDYLTRYQKNTGMWVGEVPKFWGEIKAKYNSEEIVESYDQDGQGIGILTVD